MRRNGDVPELGRTASTLGVRVPADIEPDSNGDVEPDGESGLSVRPTLDAYPATWIPRRLQQLDPDRWRNASGNNNAWGFRLGSGEFAQSRIGERLLLSPDKSDHGVIEPSRRMPVSEYERAIAETQAEWVIDET